MRHLRNDLKDVKHFLTQHKDNYTRHATKRIFKFQHSKPHVRRADGFWARRGKEKAVLLANHLESSVLSQSHTHTRLIDETLRPRKEPSLSTP